MSDNQQLDVLIAVYLIPDLAQQDFDAYVKLAGDGEIVTDGVALVVKDADGEVQVKETGDHLGRKGAKVGGGAGLVVGLFAPPLLAATAVGAAAGAMAGKFARHRVQAGIGEKMDDALPPDRPASSRSTNTTAPTLSRARSRMRSAPRPPRSTRRPRGAESRPGGGIGGTRGLREHG